MNEILYTQQLESLKNWDITFNAHVEVLPINCTSEILTKIHSGEYVYFCAEIAATRAGIKLGSAFIGGCVYNSFQQFITDSDYIKSMTEEAIEEAEQILKKLCNY